jgi:cytosine/uracil/thiamine/allantoin permease
MAMVLNGTIGARLHISFPVINRSSFGFWLSYFSVVSRVVLAMFWFGVQTFTGSECVYQMLKAIWPSIASVPNRLPPSSNITTTDPVLLHLQRDRCSLRVYQHPYLGRSKSTSSVKFGACAQ